MLYFPITKEPKPPYEINWEENLIRSTTESGHVISRRKFTKQRTTYRFKWEYLTNTEYEALKTFYVDTTSSGSIEFTYSLNIDRGAIQGDIFVQFISPPKVSYIGMGLWEVECTFREV